MSKPDRPPSDLERPRGAIRNIRDLRRHCGGETGLVRSNETIGYNPNTVPSCQCRDGGIQVNRRSPFQHSAHPWHVGQPVADPPQPALPDEARQRLIDGCAAAEIEEGGCAHPPSSTVCGHPLHDLLGYGSHVITPSTQPRFSVRNRLCISHFVEDVLAGAHKPGSRPGGPVGSVRARPPAPARPRVPWILPSSCGRVSPPVRPSPWGPSAAVGSRTAGRGEQAPGRSSPRKIKPGMGMSVP